MGRSGRRSRIEAAQGDAQARNLSSLGCSGCVRGVGLYRGCQRTRGSADSRYSLQEMSRKRERM